MGFHVLALAPAGGFACEVRLLWGGGYEGGPWFHVGCLDGGYLLSGLGWCFVLLGVSFITVLRSLILRAFQRESRAAAVFCADASPSLPTESFRNNRASALDGTHFQRRLFRTARHRPRGKRATYRHPGAAWSVLDFGAKETGRDTAAFDARQAVMESQGLKRRASRAAESLEGVMKKVKVGGVGSTQGLADGGDDGSGARVQPASVTEVAVLQQALRATRKKWRVTRRELRHARSITDDLCGKLSEEVQWCQDMVTAIQRKSRASDKAVRKKTEAKLEAQFAAAKQKSDHAFQKKLERKEQASEKKCAALQAEISRREQDLKEHVENNAKLRQEMMCTQRENSHLVDGITALSRRIKAHEDELLKSETKAQSEQAAQPSDQPSEVVSRG